MATKTFEIHETWDGRRNGIQISFDGQIELDERVLNAVDDEWRKYFYDLNTEQEIAEHIAFNLIVNNIPVNALDGWANLPDDVVARLV